MNIDLGNIVSTLGEEAIAQIGEPLGLDRELSLKAARSLAENFTGDRDAAVDAAARETGLGKEVLDSMISKMIEEARDAAVDHVKEQATTAAKGMFNKLFGR